MLQLVFSWPSSYNVPCYKLHSRASLNINTPSHTIKSSVLFPHREIFHSCQQSVTWEEKHTMGKCNRKTSHGHLQTKSVRSFRVLTEFVFADCMTICWDGCLADQWTLFPNPYSSDTNSFALYHCMLQAELYGHFNLRPRHARACSYSFCWWEDFCSWSKRLRKKPLAERWWWEEFSCLCQ